MQTSYPNVYSDDFSKYLLIFPSNAMEMYVMTQILAKFNK